MGNVKLSAKQEVLLSAITQELRRETALSYIDGGYQNKTKSYLSACSKMGRKPSKNPETSASEILSYPNVIDFIASIKEVAAERTQTNAEYVLRRLREIDELDIIDIFNDDLKGFKPLKDWPKAWRISISGMDMKTIIEGGNQPVEALVQKIKWPDKTKNLELIGRHVNVKAWEKEVEIKNVTNNIMPVPTADSIDSWEVAAKAQQEAILSGS